MVGFPSSVATQAHGGSLDFDVCYAGCARYSESLPPPYDRHPDFPTVYFDPFGRPLLDGSSDSTIAQIVPSSDNPYVRRYGGGRCRQWLLPNLVSASAQEWVRRGRRVVIHSRHRDAQVVGVSRGWARFVCGGGVSTFVVEELGVFPGGEVVLGSSVGGMVAAYGVDIVGSGGQAGPGDPFSDLHIFPAEYLADPPLPGLPEDLSRSEVRDWLAPPPVFCRGLAVEGGEGRAYARVTNDLSDKERREGGEILGEFICRGVSYSVLHGLCV
jgi:hypothetical protein